MLSGIKDSLTSAAAKSLLASKLARYGKLTDLRIGSREKTIHIEMLLEGEEESVAIEVGRYRITSEEGQNAVVVESVNASRVWLQHLLEDMLVGKPVKVPSLVLLALGKADG